MSHRCGTEPTWSTIASVIRPVKPRSDRPVGGLLTSRRQGHRGRFGLCARLHQSETTASGRHGGRQQPDRHEEPESTDITTTAAVLQGAGDPPAVGSFPIAPAAQRSRGPRSPEIFKPDRTTSTQLDRNSHERKDHTLRRSLRPNQRPPSRHSDLTGVSRVAHRSLSNPHAPATSCPTYTCRRGRRSVDLDGVFAGSVREEVLTRVLGGADDVVRAESRLRVASHFGGLRRRGPGRLGGQRSCSWVSAVAYRCRSGHGGASVRQCVVMLSSSEQGCLVRWPQVDSRS